LSRFEFELQPSFYDFPVDNFDDNHNSERLECLPDSSILTDSSDNAPFPRENTDTQVEVAR